MKIRGEEIGEKKERKGMEEHISTVSSKVLIRLAQIDGNAKKRCVCFCVSITQCDGVWLSENKTNCYLKTWTRKNHRRPFSHLPGPDTFLNPIILVINVSQLVRGGARPH